MGGEWPKQEFLIDVSGSPVRVEWRAALANAHDPDVSFAYVFCGSMRGGQHTADAFARGEAKAVWAVPSWSPEAARDMVLPYARVLPAFTPRSGDPPVMVIHGDRVTVRDVSRQGERWHAMLTLRTDGTAQARLYYGDVGLCVETDEVLVDVNSDGAAFDRWCEAKAQACATAIRVIAATMSAHHISEVSMGDTEDD